MTNPDKLADALRVDSERIAESLYEWMIGLMPNGDLLNGAVVCDHGGAINFKKALARQLESTLAASLAAPPAQGEWQPIETAPEGVRVQVYIPEIDNQTTAFKYKGKWTTEHNLSHWHPLRNAPGASSQPAPAPVQAVCNRNCDCVGECKAGVERPAAQPPAPGEAELPPLPNPQVPFIGCDPSLTDVRVLVNWYKRGATAYARAAIAALAQQRVPDAVRELPGIWCERTPRHADARAAYTQCAAELRSALASAEGNAVDLVQFRYDVEGWRDCARALAKVCDRPADCAYAEAESVRLLDLIDQQQEARGNGE